MSEQPAATPPPTDTTPDLQTPPPNAQPSPPRRPHRVRRWTLRAVIALLLLLVIAVVAITIVLNTAIPRQFVLSSLQRQLGLRGDAESLSTWWWGDTVLDDVTLALPLADEAFLEVEQLRVDHTNLPLLLLGWPLRVHTVTLVRPRLIVREDAQGRWDVAEAITLITRATGAQSAAEEERRGEAVQLPAVDLIEGTVVLINNKDQRITLAPLELHGRPENPLAWKFTATVLPEIEVEGRVAPGQRWNHQAAFRIRRFGDVVRPWFIAWPEPFDIAGQWKGEIIDNVVVGRLELEEAQVAAVHATGSLDLEAGEGSATVRPQTVAVKIGAEEPTPVRLIGGSFRTSGSQVTADDVRVGALGGTARLNGQFDWNVMSGRANASWIDISLPGDVRTQGSLSASIDTPWAGRPQVSAEIASSGVTPSGNWNGTATVRGEGRSWSDLDWSLTIPQLIWDGVADDYTLKQLTIRATTTDNVVRLVELRVAEADRLAASGLWNFETGQWELKMDARGVPLPRLPEPADIAFAAEGNTKRIDVPSVNFRTGTFVAEAEAGYVFDDPQPLSAIVQMSRPPIVIEGQEEGGAAVARGDLRGEATVVGTVDPLRLETRVDVFGRNVRFGNRELGDLAIQLAGFVDPAGVRVDSEEIDLLEGQWTLWAQYEFVDGSAHLGIDVRDLSLHQADALIAPPPQATGTLVAELRLDLPAGEREALTVRGDWLIDDLAVSGFRADQVAGNLALDQDVLTLGDIQFRYLDGRGQASVRYDLQKRETLAVNASVQTWPVEAADSELALDLTGDAKLLVNLDANSATGEVTLAGPVRAWGDEVGSFRLASAVEGRQLLIKEIHATVFEGEIDGEARFNFDDWLESTAQLQLRDIRAEPLVKLFPQLEGLHGRISGSLVASKPIDPNIPEPLRVQVTLRPQEARFNGMTIGDSGLVLLMGRDDTNNLPRPDRLILNRSTFNLAGGTVTGWGRASSHAGIYFDTLHVQLELNGLSLNEVVHAIEPEAEPMIGVLSGRITAFGPRRDRDYRLLNGEVLLNVAESDLANSDIISAFYRAFNLGRRDTGPTGTGTAHMRLENGALQITELRYRARGLQIRGAGTVEEVFEEEPHPISGYAIGTVRPLRDLKLPYMGQVDDILAALQSDVTTFRIGGTVQDPDVDVAALNEIGSGLRRLILGDVEAETRGSAGR